MPLNDLLLVFALLVAAMLFGWWQGSRHQNASQKKGGGLSKDYFRGLNYLLEDRPDDALDVFTRMVEVDSDTLETHFALGSLFRRRGEVDRAIRIHQNLIARPNLTRAERTQALFALGEDYLKAGLYDRAESLFTELARDRVHAEGALGRLLAIYEQQKDWDKAIKAARDLESVTGRYRNREISHYHCELAEKALAEQDFRTAAKLLRKATGYERDSVRVQLLSARLAETEGRWRHALRHYRRALEADPEQASGYLPSVYAVLQRQDRGGQFDEIIESVTRQRPDARKAIALAALRSPGMNSQAVENCVDRFLQESKGLGGVRQAVRRFVKLARSAQDIDEDRLMRQLLREWQGDTIRYVCVDCGYDGTVLYWQCPSCRGWETLRPRLELNVSAG